MKDKKRSATIYNSRGPGLLASTLLLLVSVAPDARANWHVSPELSVGVEFDDDTRLDDGAGQSNSDTAIGASAEVTFLYDTQLTDFSITPRLRSRWYNDNGDLDSNDQFLGFNFTHDRQKANFRVRGDYSSESVRTAERSDVDFDVDDPGEVPIDDTGRVFDTGKRDRLGLFPEFSYDLTQRTSVAFEGRYLDTSYDNDVSAILTGFTESGVGGALNFRWTPQDTISIYAYGGTFELDNASADASTTAVGLGYNRSLSPRTQLRFLVGSDSSEDRNGIDRSNPVGELSIIHRYETTRMTTSYRRAVSGSGAGGLTIRDSFILNVSHAMTPKLVLSGGIRLNKTDGLDDSLAATGRDFLQIRGVARWNYSRKISFDLDYRYTDIDRNEAAGGEQNGNSNLISLWVNWHPKPLPR